MPTLRLAPCLCPLAYTVMMTGTRDTTLFFSFLYLCLYISSTVSELPESPTLPPEMQRGEDVAAIPRTSTDYPRSPTQESNLLRSYASMPSEQLSPSGIYGRCHAIIDVHLDVYNSIISTHSNDKSTH